MSTREAQEESGLSNINILSEEIFGLYIQKFPKNKEVSDHLHYDIVFLFRGDINEKINISSESLDLKWVKLEDISKISNDKLLFRLKDKTIHLRDIIY